MKIIIGSAAIIIGILAFLTAYIDWKKQGSDFAIYWCSAIILLALAYIIHIIENKK